LRLRQREAGNVEVQVRRERRGDKRSLRTRRASALGAHLERARRRSRLQRQLPLRSQLPAGHTRMELVLRRLDTRGGKAGQLQRDGLDRDLHRRSTGALDEAHASVVHFELNVPAAAPERGPAKTSAQRLCAREYLPLAPQLRRRDFQPQPERIGSPARASQL
jgi:hypothetical protein